MVQGRTRSVTSLFLALLVFAAFATSLGGIVPSVGAQTGRIQLGQSVTGILSPQDPEDWWGATLPRGELNITLKIPSGNTADLAFDFSPFVNGAPLETTLGGSLLTQVVNSQGPGGNETLQFAAPSILLLGVFFILPGDTAIRVYSPSSEFGATNSVNYTLTVVQLQSFVQTSPGTLNTFNSLTTNGHLVYAVSISQAGAYNITVRTNQTASLAIEVFEDDLFLPVSIESVTPGAGPSSAVVVLSVSTTYLVVGPTLPISPVSGNLTIAQLSLQTISPGQTVSGSVTSTQPVFYLADTSVGNYYNFTLTPGATTNANLDVFSPSSGLNIATSSNFGTGVVEWVRDLALFYSASYATTPVLGYERFPSTGILFGPRPDKVLVRVSSSSPSGTYNLEMTSRPFPTLQSGSTVSVNLNATSAGPFYSFYLTGGGLGTYNATYSYSVRNSTLFWNSEIELTPVSHLLGSFAPELLTNLFFEDVFTGSTSARDKIALFDVVDNALANSRVNDNFSAKNTTLRAILATLYSQPSYLAVTLADTVAGSSFYTGNLTYTFKAPVAVSVGTPRTDYLARRDINIYTATLQAGHTYRLDASYVSAALLWVVYSSSGLTAPSMSTSVPVFPFAIPTDPDHPDAADYLYITPAVTATYYIVATIYPGIGVFTLLPETEYTLSITELKPPLLSVSLSMPAGADEGDSVTITGTVSNVGSYTLNNVIVTLSLSGGLTTSQQVSVTIGTLGPGQSANFSWNAAASGSSLGTARVTASSDNSPSTEVFSSTSITAPQTSPPFIETPVGVGIIAGVAALLGGVGIGFFMGKKGQKPTTNMSVPPKIEQP